MYSSQVTVQLLAKTQLSTDLSAITAFCMTVEMNRSRVAQTRAICVLPMGEVTVAMETECDCNRDRGRQRECERQRERKNERCVQTEACIPE